MRGVRRLFHIELSRGGIERAVDDELRFHFDMTMRDLVANGMSRDDARREAERRFGDVQQTRQRLAAIDHSRAVGERRAEWWSAFAQDFRYALRGLRLKPGFAAAVVLTLGLGIGANATMFGIVDRLLFRPPELMRDPATAHQVYVFETFKEKESPNPVGAYVRYADLSKWTTSFASTAAYSKSDLAVGVGDAARERRIGIVSASFFGFFDAPPAMGRYFTESEDRPPEGAAVTVLSYAMWQTQYGGRADVLGSRIQIGSMVYTIIGVAPPRFVGLWADKPPAAYIPITSYAAATFGARDRSWWTNYSRYWMWMMVRRKPGVSIATANADLTQAFAKSYGAQRLDPRNGMSLGTRTRAMAGSILRERGPETSAVTKVATWVGGVSVIVLLIACANVANLLLARALRRRREIALRLALGVSRGRLLSQLFTESVLLALLGGVAGVLVAHWGGRALRAALLEKSEAPVGLHDVRTMLFAATAALVIGLLTGLAPAFQARRADLIADLKAGSREGAYNRSHVRVVLLVLQAALSVVLLVGAGLFVRSLGNIQAVRLGYDVDPVLYVSLAMRGVHIDSVRAVELRQRLMQTAKTIPGVESASLQYSLPFWSMTTKTPRVDGIDSVRKLGQFDFNAVSAEYFATMGTRILRGRALDDRDTQRAPGAVVISESMGKALWPGRDPIGQCIRLGAGTTPCTYVVGVAEDIKDQTFEPASVFNYYVPAAQINPGGGLLLRVHGRGTRYVEAVRRRLQREMPDVAYVTVVPFSDIIGSRTRSWQLGATMFVAFGALALVLAAIGLYSVMVYNVAQRTQELGIRVALGAQARDVVRLVVSNGLGIVAVGVAIGTSVALLAGRWVKPLLFEVSPRDPAVFAVVTVTLVVIAIAASWIPAQRASRVDPNEALRSD